MFADSEQDSYDLTKRHFTESLQFPLAVIAILWLIQILQVLLDFDPGAYGVYPRRIWGSLGILTSPLVHGSWKHLISNTIPLFGTSVILFYFYKKVASRSFWLIYILTGIAVWVFARNVWHIGASGVVYGLVSFIFWSGIFRRNTKSIILGLLVMLLYSGMFMGVLPDQPGVSWESHLLGSFAGIFAAFWYKEELEDDEHVDEKTVDATEEKVHFLPQDIFEKTKAVRAQEEAERQAELERQIAQARYEAYQRYMAAQQAQLNNFHQQQQNPPPPQWSSDTT